MAASSTSLRVAGAGADDTLTNVERLAFADRSIWMGDADFVPVPMKGLRNDSYVGLRGAAIVPGARIDPNPTPEIGRAHV